MLEALTVDTFTPYVGSSFRIVFSQDLAVDADLVDARPFGAAPAPGTRAPFRLLFHGPLTPFLPQRIYRLEHTVLAPLDLFLVPLGPAGDWMRYEAIFA